jgi:hypothetical protein
VGPAREVVEPDHGVEVLREGVLDAVTADADGNEIDEVLDSGDVDRRPEPGIGLGADVRTGR